MMRWYTCTPVEFGGGPDFFARDSGLLSRGFQALGLESRAVMPGKPRVNDEPDLMRCRHEDLANPDWWAALGLDGVVLYSWGHPKYRNVAAAIHMAGIRLVLNQDSSGLVSPLSGLRLWLREQNVLAGSTRSPRAKSRCWLKILDGLTRGLIWVDPMRALHLHAGDVITAVSPMAAKRYRKLCLLYGGQRLASRVRFLPHPVCPLFHADSDAKERRIITVGRWDDEVQKRPDVLVSVLDEVLKSDTSVNIDIVGEPGGRIRPWHDRLAACHKPRVSIHGRVTPVTLALLMRRAMIAYCPSAFESFHIASAEAICCGASVVAGDSPSLPALAWFTSEGYGRLAIQDSTHSHATALIEELAAWDMGLRDPQTTALTWQNRLHAPRVAGQVLSFFDSTS